MKAMLFAAFEKDRQFATTDLFAEGWTSVGYLVHGDDIGSGLYPMDARPVPRPDREATA
jgi:hypothetical protein